MRQRRYWSVVPPLPAPVLTQTVRHYEAAGLEGIWTPQVFGPPFVTLGAAAAVTERLKLGTGVAVAFTRSPLETACAALDLDLVSNGRCVLGLGPSSRECVEDWHGATFGKPLRHLRASVALVRALIAESHTGTLGRIDTEFHHLDLSRFRNPHPPVRTDIPIYLPAVFEAACELAGEIGDGLLGHPIWVEPWVRERVDVSMRAGIARAGRARHDWDLNLWFFAAPNPDRRTAIEDARATISFYAQMPQYQRYFDSIGLGPDAATVRAAAAGGAQAANAACSDALVEAIALVGPADDLRARVARLEDVADSFTFSIPFYGLDPDKAAFYTQAIATTFFE